MNTLTLSELCWRVSLPEHTVLEIINVGIIEPLPGTANAWPFEDLPLIHT
mgnify:CR=1 FL=1